MSPRFETDNPRHSGQGARERDRIHEARWQTRGGHPTTDSDIEADSSMTEIYKDKRLYDQYKKVGYHLGKENFLRMIEKWEHDQPLMNPERNLREEVRNEFTTRMGIVKSCEKLLTADVFKGVSDEDAAINRLVGELGAEWALNLIKPRLIKLVGEDDGTESLTELWSALRDMHGVYRTKGFNKVYSRIERYRMKYGITPAKWAEIQRGGDWGDVTTRAFGEFQKQHGFLGKMWNFIPSVWHAGWIGWAGREEEHDSAMERLRETRTRALEVLGNLMSEDFQQVIDKAIKMPGGQAMSEALIKQQDEQEEQAARGMSEADVLTHRDTDWNTYIKGGPDPAKEPPHPAEENAAGYDNWVNTIFRPKYETEAKSARTGWLGALMGSLFGVRSERLPRPANT